MDSENNYLKQAEILIELALNEDIGSGDVTTDSLIDKNEEREAYLTAKADGIISGLKVAQLVFKKLDPALIWHPKLDDGDYIKSGEIIVEFKGNYRALLTGERTALNFLQRMSGIATETYKYVQAVKEYRTKILDTRKTLPGYRLLDKYAVKTGGGTNHRAGLYDLVLIKDNHISVAGGITNAVNQIRSKIGNKLKIEVETTTLQQVEEAVNLNVDIIMLDNMNNQLIQKAVELIGSRAKIEVSGNITLERVCDIAALGVDFISVGSITHSVAALDISQYFKGVE